MNRDYADRVALEARQRGLVLEALVNLVAAVAIDTIGEETESDVLALAMENAREVIRREQENKC